MDVFLPFYDLKDDILIFDSIYEVSHHINLKRTIIAIVQFQCERLDYYTQRIVA